MIDRSGAKIAIGLEVLSRLNGRSALVVKDALSQSHVRPAYELQNKAFQKWSPSGYRLMYETKIRVAITRNKNMHVLNTSADEQ
jgi:hypothetical protein